MLAELLAAEGVDPVLVEPNPLRRTVAADRGLRAVASLEETGPPADVLIDCAGVAGAIAAMLARIASHGLYLSVGYAAVPELDLAIVARRELTIRGIRSGTRADLARVLQLAADGTIRPPDCRNCPLQRRPAAFRAARQIPATGSTGTRRRCPVSAVCRRRNSSPRCA